MTLNHLDLSVANVPATRDFFVAHFGFRLATEKNADVFAVLEDAEGFTLVVSPLKKSDPAEYPSQFHVGFHVDSRARVDEIHGRMKAAGVPLRDAPIENRRGYLFYVKEPSGILVEVGTNA